MTLARPTALARTINRRTWAALVIFAGVALLIAMLGGGWWALRRVDPLLVVPGLGWAVAIFALSKPAGHPALLAFAAALLLTLFLTAIALVFSGQTPLFQLAVTALASFGWVGLAMAVWRQIAGAVQGVWSRRLIGAAFALLLGMGAQMAGWQMLTKLYVSAERPIDQRHGLENDPRPITYLLTSLPLIAATDPASMLAGDGPHVAPFLHELGRSTEIMPIDTMAAVGERAQPGSTLLLAHPAAMTPQDMVALDAFVRNGGRALIFADGLLSWPPSYPLGDPRNPPITSLLTPLLSHWGLALDAPEGLKQELVELRDGDMRLTLFSPGRLRARAAEDVACRVRLQGVLADCRVGQGRVTVLADADMLNDALWLPEARHGVIGTAANWRADNATWIADRVAEASGFDPAVAFVRPVWAR